MIPSTWQMLSRRLSAPSPRCVYVCSAQSPRAWDTQLRCRTFMSFAGHGPDVRRWQQERPELPNRSRWEAQMELSSIGLFLCVEALYIVLDRCEPYSLMLTPCCSSTRSSQVASLHGALAWPIAGTGNTCAVCKLKALRFRLAANE